MRVQQIVILGGNNEQAAWSSNDEQACLVITAKGGVIQNRREENRFLSVLVMGGVACVKRWTLEWEVVCPRQKFLATVGLVWLLLLDTVLMCTGWG